MINGDQIAYLLRRRLFKKNKISELDTKILEIASRFAF